MQKHRKLNFMHRGVFVGLFIAIVFSKVFQA